MRVEIICLMYSLVQHVQHKAAIEVDNYAFCICILQRSCREKL